MPCSSSTTSSSPMRSATASSTSDMSEPASDTGRIGMDDESFRCESAVLDGAPGGSEGGSESDASLECVPCRPRRMALRLSSSRGRPRRCTSYCRRSFSALSCFMRTSSRRVSCNLST
eukprot:scaffold67786_cov63-Phaeocystis_antarctica.AAC.1